RRVAENWGADLAFYLLRSLVPKGFFRRVMSMCRGMLPAVLVTGGLLHGPGLMVFGQSWSVASAPVKEFESIACSADGTKIVAGSMEGPVYISTNSGGTWTAALPQTYNSNWNAVV